MTVRRRVAQLTLVQTDGFSQASALGMQDIRFQITGFVLNPQPLAMRVSVSRILGAGVGSTPVSAIGRTLLP